MTKISTVLTEEKKLVHELQQGSERAFGLLMGLYQNKILSTCLGFVPNRQDAEDIVQEVFVEVFRSIQTFKEESKLSSWIYRIAINKSLEAIRFKKRKKRKAFFQSLIGLHDRKDSLDTGHFDHPGVLLENKELSEILFSKIELLPDNQRIAFIICKVEGMSYKEASEIMKLSVSSIESLLFRAKKNLQKLLEAYYHQ